MLRKALHAAAISAAAIVIVALIVPGGSLRPATSLADGGAACSWFGGGDPRDENVGAPDLSAHYWGGYLEEAAGSQIEITGSYPHARYFSFTLYNPQQQPITSIYDREIAPDPGSYNPYRGRGRPGQARKYTVHVLFKTAPAHPAPNTLYAGPPNGTNTVGLSALRIYLPVGSLSGGVPLPQIKVLSGTGAPVLTEGACSVTTTDAGATPWEAFAQESAPPGQSTPSSGTTSTPEWTRSFNNGFGNQQNSYLQVLVSHHWGQLVVFHFKAPTFPNTSRGQPIYGSYDLRYWSVCVYDSGGNYGWGCVADQNAPQRDGWVTYVVSDVAHRPANATVSNGVSWLPWGPQNEIQIMERNMLPASSFWGASQRIAEPADNARAPAIMGPYYPTSAYCSEQTFEKGGWQACLPALAKQLAATKQVTKHRSHKRTSTRGRKTRRHPASPR